MKCYWWQNRSQTNFGDELSHLILSHFAGIDVDRSSPADAEIVSTGSVLDVLPQSNWRGIVAGSGKLHAATQTNLSFARVFGVRGRLTARDVTMTTSDRKELVIADPGLLASELVPVERGKHELGVVPHWSDKDLFPRELAASRRYRYAEPILIDPTDDPLSVVSMIGSCKKIVASSLHGLVTADSFGIPRRAEPFAAMTSRHEGGMFKFLDYASAIDQPIEFGTLQLAPVYKVMAIQSELFDMLQQIGQLLHV